MMVSDVSMNAITGASGRLATRAPLRRARLVDVAVGRRAHDGLVQIPLRAGELRLELVDFGLPLLDVEGAAGFALEQLRHLRQTQLLKASVARRSP